MSHSTTVLRTKLDSLDIRFSLPDARDKKNEKEIKLSIDDKVQWSYKWTNTFEPLLGPLYLPLVYGSYSGRVIDFLVGASSKMPVLFQHGRHAARALITVDLLPLVDYQQAWNDCIDASLGRLDNNKVLAEELNSTDPPVLVMGQVMNYSVETCGKYMAPLGQALRLMNKLIDNVGEGHPLLNVGWALLSSVYTMVQRQRLDDHNVSSVADVFLQVVGVAGDCPVAQIKGKPRIIQTIECLALEVASLIDAYAKCCFGKRLGEARWNADAQACMTKCSAETQGGHHVKQTREGLEGIQEGVKEISKGVTKRSLGLPSRTTKLDDIPSVNYIAIAPPDYQSTRAYL
ncbi:hypothetical protein PAXINDRAFT_97114 [Paxillus involutus ATCC 200175]|nr:hypothetical protein PAXINDRAFT_97114 [Paxillus involutus ATCC 200175]